MMAKGEDLTAFRTRLLAAGAEILAPTNPYELLRFRSSKGVGVVYTGKRGRTWNAEAKAARDHLKGNGGSLAPVHVRGRRTDRATVNRLLERDGDRCFFCRSPLEADVTIEHLIPIAHGGPNHISNLFLAHAACNQAAGHLSGPEKIGIAIKAATQETSR